MSIASGDDGTAVRQQGIIAAIRPYIEPAPLAALFLGISSGFPYAMIGATLTTRLAQDGIDKKAVTAFTLAFLVYNLKFLWAWIVDGVHLPVIGRLVRAQNAARLARTLAAMIAAGAPLIEGLLLTAPTVHNRALRAATEDLARAVREGGSLSAAMRRAEVFPPILVHMTASGEAGGQLETMLDSAADYLEREVGVVTSAVLSLLEPAIIILMGAVVATIVLSILLPILQIDTLALK